MRKGAGFVLMPMVFPYRGIHYILDTVETLECVKTWFHNSMLGMHELGMKGSGLYWVAANWTAYIIKAYNGGKQRRIYLKTTAKKKQ